MNEFDARKATNHSGNQPSSGDDYSSLPPGEAKAIDVGALLLRALKGKYRTWDAVSKQLGVHRLTVRHWRREGTSAKNNEQLKIALSAKPRDETKAIGYVLHGEGDEPMPIGPLKELVQTAIELRKLGLATQADRIDRAVIAMTEDLDDYYPHPSLVGGKLKAVKAASQTGLGQLQQAIASYKETAQEMHDAGEPVEGYRADLSHCFLEITRALGERHSPQSALGSVLDRAKQLIEKQLPPGASRAARCQRYGIGLSVYALSPLGKREFLKWARQMMADSDAYDTHADGYDAVFEEVADNHDRRFDNVLDGKWLSSLRRN